MTTPLRAILDLLARDSVCANIVAYLDRHHHAADTARGIAQWWIRADIAVTEAALRKLAAYGVVRAFAIQGTTRVYAYADNELLRARLSEYVKHVHRNTSAAGA